MNNETKPVVRVTTKETELLQQMREEAEVVELQVYLNQYRQALYQLNQFIQQNTLGTLMLSEAVGLSGDAPCGGLDLYLIPKDPSLYAKPSLVNLVRSTNLFNIWQRSEQARAPERSADQPLPRFDWSKLEYPRFGPFKFYIGSHLGWSKEDSTDEQS
jgi:hypothetical protein